MKCNFCNKKLSRLETMAISHNDFNICCFSHSHLRGVFNISLYRHKLSKGSSEVFKCAFCEKELSKTDLKEVDESSDFQITCKLHRHLKNVLDVNNKDVIEYLNSINKS